MKRVLMLGAMAFAFASFAAPRKVALVVQNHTSDAPTLPMAAFADTLTSRLSGKTLRVVNPHNVIGVNQNRTAQGEAMPEASAQEIGRMTGADGVVTASIQEFTGEDIGVPAIAHTLKVRIALNLADAATGETVCGVDGVEFSKNYTVEKVKSDTATLYEGLMHLAAAKASEKFLAKFASVGWEQNAAKTIDVFFGCNVLGADLQIDGLSYGTCPAQLSLTPGIHNVIVSYPPYYNEFKRRVMFNQDGQTYKVVLQLTSYGESQRNRSLEYEAKLLALDKSRLELENIKNDNFADNEKKKLALERERQSIEFEQKERSELFKKIKNDNVADNEKKMLALERDRKSIEFEQKERNEQFKKMKNDNSVDYENKKLSLEREKKSIKAEQKERCELFKKQLAIADAMLERYSISGEADDYVRKTIAEGKSVFWKNSSGRIAITEGPGDSVRFATPATRTGDISAMSQIGNIPQDIKAILVNGVPVVPSPVVAVAPVPLYNNGSANYVLPAKPVSVKVLSLAYDEKKTNGVLKVAVDSGLFSDVNRYIRINFGKLVRNGTPGEATSKIPPDAQLEIESVIIDEDGICEVKFKAR